MSKTLHSVFTDTYVELRYQPEIKNEGEEEAVAFSLRLFKMSELSNSHTESAQHFRFSAPILPCPAVKERVKRKVNGVSCQGLYKTQI
ncbi:unnamed protein product [Haemonchus placei]|uniref:Uncharacterized protein n=1 Tax=Haemonchus placei TaxID=6290 RepID=A0A0N4VWS7_HAEPC|nr:unnamed protein product [Haemonchus placei]